MRLAGSSIDASDADAHQSGYDPFWIEHDENTVKSVGRIV